MLFKGQSVVTHRFSLSVVRTVQVQRRRGKTAAMTSPSRDERRAVRLESAFREEQRRSLALGARMMVVVLAVVFVWINIENGLPAALFFYPFLFAFAGLLLAPYLLDRAGRAADWHQYLFTALWVTLFTFVVLIPNPLDRFDFPVQFRLQFGNETYLFLIVIGAAFTYSVRLVLWTGFVAAAVWSVAVGLIYMRPDTAGEISNPGWAAMSEPQRLAAIASPYRVDVGKWVREALLLLFSASIVAAFVWRSRSLVLRQAAAERERANLSRYFSANMVDELAQSDDPLEETRSQEIAVLFADIVGFTGLTGEMAAAEVIGLLREFHERMADAVFSHGGTLDKFLGDGVMATFGTPRVAADDATRALRCAQTMLDTVAAWNQSRTAAGRQAVRIGVGVHYGPVIIGDIGSAQCFEFAVVGDTVNVASRLEHLTRALEVDIVASDAVVERTRRESGDGNDGITGLRPIGDQEIRGRRGAIGVWVGNATPRT